MKQDILDIIDEIINDGVSEEEYMLLNVIYFILKENEFDEEMLMEIGDAIDNYIGDEDEEMEGDFEDETEDMKEIEESEDENEFDIDELLIEKMVRKIRGGKIVKFRPGYRGGKKIKPSTRRKLKKAAIKRSRRPVKASTKRKRLKSRIKNARKFKAFLKRKRK